VRDIQAHLAEIYGVEVGHDLISRVSDAVIDDVRAWQQRPLAGSARRAVIFWTRMHEVNTDEPRAVGLSGSSARARTRTRPDPNRRGSPAAPFSEFDRRRGLWVERRRVAQQLEAVREPDLGDPAVVGDLERARESGVQVDSA
jgi:hypothetical protein